MSVFWRARFEILEQLVQQAIAAATGALFLASGGQAAVWQAQTVWHVDFDNGNDLADGKTHATALLTLRELQRRLKGLELESHDITVFTYGDNKQSDPLNTTGWIIDTPEASVVIRRLRFIPADPSGPLGVYSTGTITAIAQARNRALNHFWQVTCTKTGGAPETYVNPNLDPFGNPFATGTFNCLRIVGGPRDGVKAWTAAGNDPIVAGTVTTSEFIISNPLGAANPIAPQVGDAYQLQQYPKLYVDHLDIDGNDDNFGSGFYLQGYSIYPTHGFDSQSAGTLKATSRGGCIVCCDCIFMTSLGVFNFGEAFLYFQNCATLDALQFIAGANHFVDGGLFHLGITAGGGGTHTILGADAMIVNGSLFAGDGGVLHVGTCGIKGGDNHQEHGGAIAARDGKIILTSDFEGNTALYGFGSSPSGTTWPLGIAVSSGGKFYHNGTDLANVTLKGTDPAHDFSIDNALQSHPTDNVTGQPKALQANTFANLQNAAVFNGIATLPESGSGSAILILEPQAG